MRDVRRVHPRFDDELVIDRKQLKNQVTWPDDATGSVAVELDHDAADGRLHLGSIGDISSCADLFIHIVEIGFRLTQLFNGFLNRSCAKLHHLLICSSNPILCVADATHELAEIA